MLQGVLKMELYWVAIDMYVAKLLPITILTYAVNCICFCHSMKTQHCCLYPCERHNLPLAVHPPPPSTPPPPTNPPAIRDSTVEVAENSAGVS